VRFARIVFAIAGVWGILVLTPLFFLHDITGAAYPPPATYPHFFYGFLSVGLAWQIAFLAIAADPVRYRLMMLASLIEKAGYIIGAAVLFQHGRIVSAEASTAVPDFVLLVLFAIAFVKTPVSESVG
jgi:hypothetical protein